MSGKVLLSLAVLGALVLAGCASPEPLPRDNATGDPPVVPPSMPSGPPPTAPPGPTPPPGTGPVAVRVLDNDYDPRAIAVAVGGSARFTNEGDAQHSVTLQREGAASTFFDETLQPGQSVSVSFPEAGRYDLRCIYHSIDFDTGQVGDVTVA